MADGGLAAYGERPVLDAGRVTWQRLPAVPIDDSVVRCADEPFSASGGLKLLTGNLGRAVIKVSAVPDDCHVIEAPALVFESQEALLAAFNAGGL